jgi:hypothetical protein
MMGGKVIYSWVQGSHTTDTSKSITFSAEPGSFGAIKSNKDSCPPELGCGWPEPPCRALKSNTPQALNEGAHAIVNGRHRRV